MEKRWFRAKTHGWGWYPASIEGWALTLGYLVFLFGGQFVFVNAVNDDNVGKATAAFIAYACVLTAGLCLAAWKTGDRPVWRWGGKK